MNKNDRSRNMMTGLGVVVFIMLVVVLLPFMIPVLSVVFSMLIAFGLMALGLWLCIILITSVGAMFNSVKDKNVGGYTKERVKDGRSIWNKGIDSFTTILQRMRTRENDDVIYGEHDKHEES